VGIARLPLVTELRNRLLLAFGHEDRVVAESLRPPWFVRDVPFEHAGPTELAAVRSDQNELADVPSHAVVDALELAKQLLVRLGALRPIAR